MLNVFVNAWKVADLRKKMLYTLMIMAIIRLGTHISLPGIDVVGIRAYQALNQGIDGAGMLLYSVITGGANAQWSIFSMGIGPYISASIIMQLLTVAIPKLEQMRKEGESGRKKIQTYSRYLTIILALIQASATVYKFQGYFLPQCQNMIFYGISVIALVSSTALIMWLAEAITKNGVGNGSSMVIFTNIISSLPAGVSYVINTFMSGVPLEIAKVIGLIVIFVAIIAFVVLIQQGERRIPVQYSKKVVGRTQTGGSSSFIPIKVNTAGVISIIFAVSLLQFPETIGQFVPGVQSSAGTFFAMLRQTHPVGATLYILLIIVFTYFYTSISMNPAEMAENMKKNGGFIPGIRPGTPTSQFITTVLYRVTFVGAMAYALIALVPILLSTVLQFTQLGIGGTTLIIVVGVALDTVKALESQLVMRNYKGFLNS